MAATWMRVAVKCNCKNQCLTIFRMLHAGHNSKQSTTKLNVKVNEQIGEKLTKWMKIYEDFIGLTEVKNAQRRVIAVTQIGELDKYEKRAEEKFAEAQEARRSTQRKLQQLLMKLKEIHLELDKTHRGEDKYLQLVTQEHAIIKEERSLSNDFQFYEKSERDYFSSLSQAVRDGHEGERAYAEKTKYWSIIGSICGTVIGIVGATINNRVRLRELRDLVRESTSSAPKLQELLLETSNNLTDQQTKISACLTEIRSTVNESGKIGNSQSLAPDVKDHQIETLETVKQLDVNINRELNDIKALITAQKLASLDPNVADGPIGSNGAAVVYLGRDIETLVKDAQRNLEWKIKINSLTTVAMIYGAFAVTVPLLYKIFGGGE